MGCEKGTRLIGESRLNVGCQIINGIVRICDVGGYRSMQRNGVLGCLINPHASDKMLPIALCKLKLVLNKGKWDRYDR
ncbi:hypothetical protein HZ326_10493 [Fusarium oxysporum f. sp. albedinis]|nr:hypothetical protein HZ326_10493 [Fusarium oxysporum f. sp. albedinis]